METTNPTIWLKLPWERQPTELSLDARIFGNLAIVKLHTGSRTPIQIGGNAPAIVEQLRLLARIIEGRPIGAPDCGIIRAEIEPEQAATTGPAAPRQTRQITNADLTLTGEADHDWPIFYARFSNSPALLSVMTDFFKEYYKVDPARFNLTSPGQPAALPQPNPLTQDLATVLAAGEAGLYKPDGSPNQSEIGRRLGIRNAGTYNRDRILAVVEALEASTTTTQAAERPATTANHQNGRQQAA